MSSWIRSWGGVATLLAALALVLLVTSNGARSGIVPANGRIAFSSSRPPGDSTAYNVWTVNPSGTGMVTLTSSGNSNEPAWYPPNSTKLAFSTNGLPSTGFYAIAFMDADGQNKTLVIDPNNHGNPPTPPGTGALINQAPTWSPDGTKLAFHYTPTAQYQIARVDSTGLNLTQLTSTNTGQGNFWPAWSPDGTKIAFESDRGGNFDLYVMDAVGGDTLGNPAVQLTTSGAVDELPAWSPDGTKLAFASNRDGDYEIYVMNAAPEGGGNTPVQLTNNTDADEYPAWSPDGTRIVFSSNRASAAPCAVATGNTLLFTMSSTNGSGVQDVTCPPASSTANDIRPSWGTGSPTAVAGLASLHVTPITRGMRVTWRTTTEVGVAGFNLWRTDRRGVSTRVNRALIAATHPLGGSYSVVDPLRGLTYRVQLVDAG